MHSSIYTFIQVFLESLLYSWHYARIQECSGKQKTDMVPVLWELSLQVETGNKDTAKSTKPKLRL